MFLKPDYNLSSLGEIDFDVLDVKLIIFDLDSTLLKSKTGNFTQNIIDLLDNLQKKFLVVIASNNKNKNYISMVQSQVHCEIVGNANKPNPKIIKHIMFKHNVSPEKTVIIGDRPLTDVLVGKLAGTKTILVDSISRHQEGIPTRFVRTLERIFIKK